MQNLLTKFGSFLWRMHLIVIINIILIISIAVAVVVLQGTSEAIYLGIIVFFLLTPYTLLFKPKTILSRNILFMSMYTYFTIPFTLNIWVLPLNISIPKFLFSIFVTSILIFISLYFYNRKNHLKEFLDHSKLSLDIIRFIFVVILTLTTVYAMINNDFSAFKSIVSIFEYNASIEELRKSYQLAFRLLAIPFVFSASVLRIVIDWVSLKK
ncbi:hypothetical protein SAMN04487970_1014124 [Paenibacillus tianmuensis]|uniref:Uncharacterized protein n=1 Tax=Paenibacillus tianmuensis TaxID=624147 RepID=A0A1G4RE69_9BACL|nr:hypothetical protein [Paenibacillus tianmuensis]SCW55047.1 hypothetical protein SAMN04487970_1014124 [Paenibacillus tianmuensis]